MTVTNGYATAANAQAFLNQLGGATLTLGVANTPTLAQVESWLDSLAAQVDALLSANGYGTVPATGTNDVLFIGRFVAQKGAAMAFGAGFMYDDEPDKVKRWSDEWNTFLDKLESKAYRLIDQSPRSRIGVLYSKRHTEA